MKQISSLRKSESGVIHHLGLFILGAVVLAGIGFAVFTVVQNNRGGDDSPITVEIENVDEDTAAANEQQDELAGAEAEAESAEETNQEDL